MVFKTFAAGATLPASDVNTYLMQQAVIGCTSTTRPSSPQAGMTIYETDTNRVYHYDGAAWQPGSVKPGFAARQNAVTSIANAADTTVVLQIEDRDNDAAYDNTTGIWTCPRTGLYVFAGTVSFASNATGVRGVMLLQSNGLFARNWVTAATDPLGKCSASAMWIVTAGATVKLQAYQSSGGALNTSGNNDTTFLGIWLSQ
jgi:hypothetical protein